MDEQKLKLLFESIEKEQKKNARDNKNKIISIHKTLKSDLSKQIDHFFNTDSITEKNDKSFKYKLVDSVSKAELDVIEWSFGFAKNKSAVPSKMRSSGNSPSYEVKYFKVVESQPDEQNFTTSRN